MAFPGNGFSSQQCEIMSGMVRRDMDTHVLPNGLIVKQANARETIHLYQDIFEKKVYFQHGVSFPEGAVVLDAGANIGMFTLFTLKNCPTAQVHAFEPAPKTFEILRANTSSYSAVQVNNCGLGAEVKEESFVFLPTATTGSGFYDERIIPTMKERLHRAIMNDPERSRPYQVPLGEELLQYRLDELFKPEVVTIQVRTVSSYIDEKQIRRIDLLKIDVEGKECAVMSGIRDEHWGMIRQMVIEAHEVHSGSSSAPEVLNLLRQRGFSVHTIPEDGMLTTMVYARR